MSKLQEVRKSKGFTQLQLSEKTGIIKRNIIAFENGERSIDGAGLDKLIPLALALDCKISDILEDIELIEQFQKLGI